ncbi:MAG: hypothetical protein ACYDC7_03530 [Acidithiobacillus ferrivorans]
MSRNKKPTTQAFSGHFGLKGEGFFVPIAINMLGQGTSTSAMNEFNIEMGQAVAPSRKFVADKFAAKDTLSSVRILFIQNEVDGITPRALLDLRLSHHPLRSLLAGKLGSIATYSKATVDFEVEYPSSEPEQTVALSANFFRTGINEVSSCIDFYYASPFSLQEIASIKKLFLEDVVRVQIPQEMLGEIIKKLKEIVADVECGVAL